MAYNAVYTDPAHDHCFAFFAFETDEAAHIAAKELYQEATRESPGALALG